MQNISETCTALADQFESQLTHIYIVATISTFFLTLSVCFFIFFMIGWSAFTLLQSIGSFLLFAVMGLCMLKLLKKRYLKKLKQSLERHHLTLEIFVAHIHQTPQSYELAISCLKPMLPMKDHGK